MSAATSGANESAFVMRREVVDSLGGRRLIAVDTIAHVKPEDAGQVVVTGSHGGISSGEYAGRAPLAAVFFNDAGVGKDRAGVAGLDHLQHLGIAAGAVAHDSAVIGDALETLGGVITTLNPLAQALGFREGEPLKPALKRVFAGAAS